MKKLDKAGKKDAFKIQGGVLDGKLVTPQDLEMLKVRTRGNLALLGGWAPRRC